MSELWSVGFVMVRTLGACAAAVDDLGGHGALAPAALRLRHDDGSWGSGGQHFQASSSATLQFGDFDPGTLSGGGQHDTGVPGAFFVTTAQSAISPSIQSAIWHVWLLCAFSARAHAPVLTAVSLAADMWPVCTLHLFFMISALHCVWLIRSSQCLLPPAGSPGLVPFTGFEGASDALEGALEDDAATFGALEDSSGGYGDSMQYGQSAYDGYGGGGDGPAQQGYGGMAQQELSMEEMMADDGGSVPSANADAEPGECWLMSSLHVKLRTHSHETAAEYAMVPHCEMRTCGTAEPLDLCVCPLPAGAPESHGAALLRAAADACGLAGGTGMQLQAAAAARCEKTVNLCILDS